MKTLVAIACFLLLAGSAEAQTRKRSASAKAGSGETSESTTKSEEAEKKTSSKTTKGSAKPKSAAKSAPDAEPAPKSDKASSKEPAVEQKTTKSEQIASTLKKSTAIDSEKKASSGTTSGARKPATAEQARAQSRSGSRPRYDAGDETPASGGSSFGPNIALDPEDLADFEKNPRAVQRLLQLSLNLTDLNLTYRYGSADPSSGGMDCSGTIYYLLKSAGIKDPPRDSTGLYLWTEREGTLHRVSPLTLKDPSMDDLQPGDLLFWEGTYSVLRSPPISHTMIYLGREKKTGLPVMIGASDGRTYAGVRRNGVSVFDFKLPRAGSPARFVGYARVPGLVK